ncbi:UNVERIFIED_CONTAM: hypothetical protein GTU68_014920 [Idotea baltica]|nr:hypothetical protein [Idotea baltica]
MNYGATITAIEVPIGSNKVQVACGFDTLGEYFSEDYKSNAPYFGCTVGRYASRIKDGTFSIDGKQYTTACNDGSNHLHGGITGFDKRIWDAKIGEGENGAFLIMVLHSAHLDEGYPGAVDIEVIFQLTEDNKIEISYNGLSDQETPLSLTNHTYFNLSGFQNTIESIMAMIEASTFLKPDETNVPIGEIASVSNTPADLRNQKALSESLKDLETGFEHYYLFDNYNNELNEVASFTNTQNGLELRIHTTEPGALFYTGYFTSDELGRNNNERYGKYKGLCFETSRYPNGPNIEGSPLSTTAPGRPFKSKTVYQFIHTSIEGLEL